jgi:hypothetical protein
LTPAAARGVQQCRTGRGRGRADYGGDAIEIGFNVTYSIDALANMSQDMVKIELADSNSLAFADHSGQHVLQVRSDAHAHLTHPTSR